MAEAGPRDAALARIARYLLPGDLSRTSLRRLALAAGLNDRVFALHFRDRSDALRGAFKLLLTDFEDRLQAILPDPVRLSPEGLSAVTRSLAEAPPIRPYMSLWFEVIGAAARGEPPFVEISGSVLSRLLDWIEARLEIADPADRRAMAAIILTTLNPVLTGTILTGANAAVLRQADWS